MKKVQDIIKEAGPASIQKGVKLVYNIVEGLPKVFSSLRKLQEIFSNLIDNAVKYSKSGGEVVISEELADNFLKVSITDSGLGMSPEDLTKIFTPYFRSDSVKAIPGTGLGLFIVKKLIDDMGGKIEVKSTLNVGTTFLIFLPINS